MIDDYLIQQIKDRANKEFVSVVSRYMDLRSFGKYYRGLCPFHSDSHPSLDFYLNDNNECVFICRSCGKAGDIVDFIMEIEHVKFDEAVKMLGAIVGIDAENGKHYVFEPTKTVKTEVKPKVELSLPFAMVEKSMENDSVLIKFLKSKFDASLVNKVVNDYFVGEYNGWTIYWQIDKDGNVKNGKLMEYASDGHRVKGEGHHTDWIGSKMQRLDKMQEGEVFGKCLFGEHLINKESNRDKTIILCEGEKSAIIGAICSDEYVWVSCGGLGNLNAKMLKSLKGRNVIIYPDAGYYDKWIDNVDVVQHGKKSNKGQERRGDVVTFKSIFVCPNLESLMSEGKVKYGDDFADYILASKESENQPCSIIDEGKAWEIRCCYIAACKQIFLTHSSMLRTDFVSKATRLYGGTWWSEDLSSSIIADMTRLGILEEQGGNLLFHSERY